MEEDENNCEDFNVLDDLENNQKRKFCNICDSIKKKKYLSLIITISIIIIISIIIFLIAYLFTHKSNISLCEIGSNEKCLICDETNSTCEACNIGYYLPKDDKSKLNCRKCTVNNCGKCYGTISENICESCDFNLIPFYKDGIIQKCEYDCQEGKEDMCLSCDKIKNICLSCNPGYKLVNGKCIINYSFKATYYSNISNENVKLINYIPTKIVEMKVDNKIVFPSLNYTFQKIGYHYVYILFNAAKKI